MEELFDSVKRAELIFHVHPLTSDIELAKLKRLFCSLELHETSESLPVIMGGLMLELFYNNGSSQQIFFSGKFLSYKEKTFYLDQNICQDVRKLFV